MWIVFQLGQVSRLNGVRLRAITYGKAKAHTKNKARKKGETIKT